MLAVAFTVSGLAPGESGTVTFTDAVIGAKNSNQKRSRTAASDLGGLGTFNLVRLGNAIALVIKDIYYSKTI
jgi:hypothetical protein